MPAPENGRHRLRSVMRGKGMGIEQVDLHLVQPGMVAQPEKIPEREIIRAQPFRPKPPAHIPQRQPAAIQKQRFLGWRFRERLQFVHPLQAVLPGVAGTEHFDGRLLRPFQPWQAVPHADVNRQVWGHARYAPCQSCAILAAKSEWMSRMIDLGSVDKINFITSHLHLYCYESRLK